MRVAHLDTGRSWRGGQGQVLLLLRELRAQGIEQLLLAPHGPLLERAERQGFATHAWNTHGELDPLAQLGAWRALRAFRPDVAHLHSAHAHALGVAPARAAGVRGVVVARRVDFKVRTNLLSRLKYAGGVDRYFCISLGVRDAMLASGLPAERLALVPSGIDLAAVRAEANLPAPDLRAELGLAPGTPVVGTVASLAPHKNHALLLEAVPRVHAALPDVRFVWLGEGECRGALERRRAELGLADVVLMPGFRPDVRALMKQFDLFVLSSYLEGLCTSLLDAQAIGVPIVATAVGGVPEVVQDGTSGRLVRTLAPEPLADAIVEALAHPERRAAWVAGGSAGVAAFSCERTARRTREEYERVLAGRGGRGGAEAGARDGR